MDMEVQNSTRRPCAPTSHYRGESGLLRVVVQICETAFCMAILRHLIWYLTALATRRVLGLRVAGHLRTGDLRSTDRGLRVDCGAPAYFRVHNLSPLLKRFLAMPALHQYTNLISSHGAGVSCFATSERAN
jgi:hypothetical protein